MMDQMSWDVRQWSPISVTRRSTLGVKLQAFVSQLRGIVTVATTATITAMKKSAAQLHARITSSSVKMESAFSKLMSATEMTIVGITATNLMSMLVYLHRSGVQWDNGDVQAQLKNVSTLHRCVTENQIVPTAQTKEKDAIWRNVNIKMVDAQMGVRKLQMEPVSINFKIYKFSLNKIIFQCAFVHPGKSFLKMVSLARI